MRSWASGGSASSPSGHTISSEGSWVREKGKIVGIVRGDAEKEKYKEEKKVRFRAPPSLAWDPSP